MSDALRILHVEDDPDVLDLVRATLARGGLQACLIPAMNRAEFDEALRGPVDLIVSDSAVPGLDAGTVLAAARSFAPPIPFLLMSGAPPSRALAALTGRYLLKTELHRLPDALRTLLREQTEGRVESGGLGAAAERLITAVQELSLVRDLPSLQAVVRRAARDLTGADGATFILREGDQCHYADEEAIAPLWKGKRFPMSACISGWAMLHGRPAIIEDIYADARIPADAYRPTFVQSLAMVPIRASAPIGAIGNYWARPHRATAQEVRLLQALADSTSVAMENLQLYQGLEQRVRERTAQLESAHAELEAFNFSVSHDLRSPLHAIDGFTELLLQDLPAGLEERTLDHLRRIRRASQRMGQLIEDLLRLSGLSRTELHPEPVDLGAMAAEIAADLRIQSPDRKVRFEIAPRLLAWGDARLLRIALENLLGNAWKYTSKTADARIALSRDPGGERAFRLQDNGAGFEMAQADRLFGPFQRLHSEREFPGTGIGLATVRRILARHGGRIWAEAEPGQGATFFFTLPDHPSDRA